MPPHTYDNTDGLTHAFGVGGLTRSCAARRALGMQASRSPPSRIFSSTALRGPSQSPRTLRLEVGVARRAAHGRPAPGRSPSQRAPKTYPGKSAERRAALLPFLV